MNEEFSDVMKKVLAARAERKAGLTGIELMQYNLYWRLRGWIMRETGYRCVSVGEVVDKVRKYAPKAILRSRAYFEFAVKDLWSGAHGYDIDSDEDLREGLEWELSYIF